MVVQSPRLAFSPDEALQAAIDLLALAESEQPVSTHHNVVVLQAGRNVLVLSKCLGHSNVSITTGYLRARPAGLAAPGGGRVCADNGGVKERNHMHELSEEQRAVLTKLRSGHSMTAKSMSA